MKLFLFICSFLAAFFSVYAALALYPADPGHPGHCYAKDIGQMDYGEEKTIKDCLRVSCYGDGTIQLASCGLISTPCGLTPIDPSKSYPDCCPQPKPC